MRTAIVALLLVVTASLALGRAEAARAGSQAAHRRDAGTTRRHHRRRGRRSRSDHAHFRKRKAGGRDGTGPHRRDGDPPARERPLGAGLRRLVHAQRQRRNDRHDLDPGERAARRAGGGDQYPQRRRRAGRHHRVGGFPEERAAAVVAAGRRRDLRRRSERHQWLPREAGARARRSRRRRGRPAAGRGGRRRHGNGLPWFQGRHRDGVAEAVRAGGRLYRRRAGAVQLRIAT